MMRNLPSTLWTLIPKRYSLQNSLSNFLFNSQNELKDRPEMMQKSKRNYSSHWSKFNNQDRLCVCLRQCPEEMARTCRGTAKGGCLVWNVPRCEVQWWFIMLFKMYNKVILSEIFPKLYVLHTPRIRGVRPSAFKWIASENFYTFNPASVFTQICSRVRTRRELTRGLFLPFNPGAPCHCR